MTNYNYLLYQIVNNTAIITLNRPNVLNSINKSLGEEFKDILKVVDNDENIRAILITGNGKGFCAGQDLEEAIEITNQPSNELSNLVRDVYNPLIKSIRSIEKPIVCAVNGVAAGAGANIALACDIVIASEKATFIQAFSKIGLIPDSGGTYFLPRLIGSANAMAYMMLGNNISAKEAYNVGMIYKLFPHDSYLSEAKSIAFYLASQPTKALGLIKQLLKKTYENSLEQQLELEAEMQSIASNTLDYKEGVTAFLEKRKPNFKGK
jgi:2-(1,2-epoxy-1,2-dihydrophenyl)acetyl-CoA isomerase